MIAIVADDLSGACDTAVKLCGAGGTIQVLMDATELQLPESGQDLVLAVTTNSRAMMPKEAYQRVWRVAMQLKEKEWSLIYKKVDSLLRGNAAQEILALMDAMDYKLSVIAPAVPNNGRMVLQGKLLESEKSKAGVSALERLHAERLRVAEVSVEVLEQGVKATAEHILGLYQHGYNAVLVDGTCESHLEIAADAIKWLPMKVLPVGAAGFLPYLIERRQTGACTMLPKLSSGERTLVVAGTGHPTTQKQIRNLLACKGIACVRIDVERCLNGEGEAEIMRCAKMVKSVMQSDVRTLLVAVSSLFENGEKREVSGNGEISAPLIVDAVAKLTRQIMRDYTFGVLFVMGGETAYHVLEKLHTSTMEILGEFLPGVPVNRGYLDGKMITVVTKSGGFGTEKTIADFVNSIQQVDHADMVMEGA